MRKLLIAAGLLLTSAPAYAAMVLKDVPPWERGHTGEFFTGFGFGGFTSDLGRTSDVGFFWNLRGGYNFTRMLGAELNYQGTNSDVNTFAQSFGAFSGTAFTHQQITADLKAGVPFMVGPGVFRPYGFAGVGYGHIGISSNIVTTFPFPEENAAAFPFGIGMSYDIGPGFVLDTRYTYNVLTETAGNNWNVGFNVGARFGGY